MVNKNSLKLKTRNPKRGIESSIVLFDGVCNLCNASVNFIIDNDRKKHFRFAALQSKAGRAILKKFNFSATHIDTLVLVEGGKIYTRSDAALHIAKKLKPPLPLLFSLMFVPPFVRDAVYVTIAKNRYRWFGEREYCRVPAPELKDRFLD